MSVTETDINYIIWIYMTPALRRKVHGIFQNLNIVVIFFNKYTTMLSLMEWPVNLDDIYFWQLVNSLLSSHLLFFPIEFSLNVYKNSTGMM